MLRPVRLLFAVASLTLFSQAVRSEPAARNEQAKTHYQAGLAYVDDPTGPKWEEALREFRTAYRASGQWKLLNNIGLCALNLERDQESIEAYREYLSRSGPDLSPQTRAQIEKDVAMLSASLVRIDVLLDENSTQATILDERRNSKGELIVNRYPVRGRTSSLGLHPGHHKIIIEATGYQSEEWAFEAEPASKHVHHFKLEPREQLRRDLPPTQESRSSTRPSVKSTTDSSAPESGRHVPASFYVGLATTAVFAAAATTTSVLVVRKNGEFERANDSATRDHLADQGHTLTLLTDVGFGVALLSAGITTYLYFSSPIEHPQTRSAGRLSVTPALSPSTAGLALTGSL